MWTRFPLPMLIVCASAPFGRAQVGWTPIAPPRELLLLLEHAGGDFTYTLGLDRVKVAKEDPARARLDTTWVHTGPSPDDAALEWARFERFARWFEASYVAAAGNTGLGERQFTLALRVAQSRDGRYAQEPALPDSGSMSLYESPEFYLSYSLVTRQAMHGPDVGHYMRFDVAQVMSPLPVGAEVARRFEGMEWSESTASRSGATPRLLRAASKNAAGYETRIALDEYARPIAGWARGGAELAVASAWIYAGPLGEDLATLVPSDVVRIDSLPNEVQMQRFTLDGARAALVAEDLSIELPAGALLTEHTPSGKMTVQGRTAALWPAHIQRVVRRPARPEPVRAAVTAISGAPPLDATQSTGASGSAWVLVGLAVLVFAALVFVRSRSARTRTAA